MKKYVMFCSALLVFFLIGVGCSNSRQTDVPEALKVSVKTEPELLKVNEEVTIKAIVTQGKEKIDDADEVAFEILKSGEKKRKLVTAKKKGDGVYFINYTFLENGTYFITAHVTARDMHTMPQIEVKVAEK